MGTPATVVIDELTGSSPDVGAVTKVRLFSDDVATNQGTPQVTNPVVIPSSGFNYSYWKAVCLEITAGSGYSITNIRHIGVTTSWTFGSGGELRRGNRDAGDKGCPDGSYQQAGGTAGTTGFAIEDAAGSNGHAYYKSQTTPTANVASDTGAGALIDSSTYTSTGRTKHVVLQVKVDTVANGAVQGTQAAKTLTWTYDES
jgi:hypothetical protein